MSLITYQFLLEDVRLYAACNSQFEMELQKCIRMGKIMFKILIWGGIWLDIRSEIKFYGSASGSP